MVAKKWRSSLRSDAVAIVLGRGHEAREFLEPVFDNNKVARATGGADCCIIKNCFPVERHVVVGIPHVDEVGVVGSGPHGKTASSVELMGRAQ